MFENSTYRKIVAGVMLALFCAVGIVNIHQWQHIDDSVDDTTCELCIVSLQQEDHILPPPAVVGFQSQNDFPDFPATLFTATTVILDHQLCALGFPNRPPPAIL